MWISSTLSPGKAALSVSPGVSSVLDLLQMHVALKTIIWDEMEYKLIPKVLFDRDF